MPPNYRGVAQGVALPTRIASGSYMVVHDAGAYTLSMFSRYNSRQAPPVYGFTAMADGGNCKVVPLTQPESTEDALRLWQPPNMYSGIAQFFETVSCIGRRTKAH